MSIPNCYLITRTGIRCQTKYIIFTVLVVYINTLKTTFYLYFNFTNLSNSREMVYRNNKKESEILLLDRFQGFPFLFPESLLNEVNYYYFYIRSMFNVLSKFYLFYQFPMNCSGRRSAGFPYFLKIFD